MLEQKENHFIKNIEIKNFKCFEDFKAEGFGRVNLIGGKNNVGKTAFMEALYLYNTNKMSDVYKKLLVLKTYRNMQEILLSNNKDEDNLRTLILENDNINIGVERRIELDITHDDNMNNVFEKYYLTNILKIEKNKDTGLFSFRTKDKEIFVTMRIDVDRDEDSKTFGEAEEYTTTDNKEVSLSNIINKLNSSMSQTKYRTSKVFIGTNLNDNELLDNIIGDLKLNGKYNDLNKYLHQLFGIESIDFIHKKPIIKIEGKHQELSALGEGIKSIIFYLGSLLTLKEKYIFIDEIENGIHYTKLDEVWKLILEISKQQNVQVFATTHSKECIESYARVAKQLEDKEITFIKMTQLKDAKIMAGVRDYDMLQYTMNDGHEVRGV